MVKLNTTVRDSMSLFPVFVFKNSTIIHALEIMKSFCADCMPVINEDFSIIGILNKRKIIKQINEENFLNEIKTKTVEELLDTQSASIVLYQRMTILEAYSIMKCLDVNGLPVADLPWEKKMIGYLWLDDIENIIEENYMQISV